MVSASPDCESNFGWLNGLIPERQGSVELTHKTPRVSQTLVIIWEGLFKAVSLTFSSRIPQVTYERPGVHFLLPWHISKMVSCLVSTLQREYSFQSIFEQLYVHVQHVDLQCEVAIYFIHIFEF